MDLKKPLKAAILSLICLITLVGCKKDKIDEENLRVPRILVESRNVDYGSLTGGVAELPLSGARIPVQKTPLITEFQIQNIELVKVDLGLALLIQTDELGARALYRGTVSNMGARLVLTVNGNPIGARRIDGAIQDGNIYTFVELPDDELEELVIKLRESLVEIKKMESW